MAETPVPSPRRRMISSLVMLVVVLAALFIGRPEREPILFDAWKDGVMGTTVRVKVFAIDDLELQRLAEPAFVAMMDIDALLSDYKEDSQLSLVNREAFQRAVALDSDFVVVLRKALEVSAATSGGFDVTIGPLIDLWRTAANDNRMPSDSAFAAVRERVGYQALLLDGDSLRFAKPGLRLDLGAIAKGYAVDKAVEALKQRGVHSAIVDAGGDLYVLGSMPDKSLYKIGIQHPRIPDSLLCALQVENRAVTTSGDYQRSFRIGETVYNHIIDARTGWPIDEAVSVTVVATTAMAADALSTAVTVLGLEQGMAMIEGLPDAEALIVTLSGPDSLSVHRSSGFGAYLAD